MGLFGKSEEEIRIEIIQREVRIINPLIMSLLTIEEKGKYYCQSHTSEIRDINNKLMMHMQVIQEYSNNMHPSSFDKIPVQWSDGVSTGSMFDWMTLATTTINNVADQLEEWGIYIL